MIQARRLLAVLAAAALAAGSLGFGVVASGSLAGAELVRAAAGPRRPGLSATTGVGTRASARAAASAGTGAGDVSNLGSGGWKVASSAAATQTGEQISTPGFDTGSWLSVRSHVFITEGMMV